MRIGPLVAGGAAVLAAGAGIAWTVSAVRRGNEERRDAFNRLPEPLQQAATGANDLYGGVQASHDASIIAASVATRDAGEGASLVERFQGAYDGFRGGANASGVIAAAAIDRDWSTEQVRGRVQDAYDDIRASGDASAYLAITAMDTGLGARELTRLYGDVRASSWASAVLADAGARHGIGAAQLNDRMREVDRAPGWIDVDASAVLVAASADTGAELDALVAATMRAWEGERGLTQLGAARLVAVASGAGIDPELAVQRWRELEPHLPGGYDDAAVIVANHLFAEHRPGSTAPTYLYAIETPESDD